MLLVIQCPEPPLVERATRHGSSLYYESVWLYHCDTGLLTDDGYTTRSITCQQDETWSNDKFTCEGNNVKMIFHELQS